MSAASTTKTPSAQALLADAATNRADDLSLKLSNLTEIVKLAAFASEARRTLEGIDAMMKYSPEIRVAVSANVATPGNWKALEDASSNVLSHVARQLESINDDFTRTVYDLANAASATAKNGGTA